MARLGSWTWHLAEDRMEWSDTLYAIFGLDRATFEGNLADVVAQAVHPDDRAAIDASYRAMIEEGTAHSLEYRVIRPDQSVRTVWGEASEMAVDAHGRPVRLAGIVQDITERKEAEQERERLLLQLQQAQKMETIGRLAGGIAHDFNNLLAVILMRLEMALALAEANSPIRRHLEESLRAGQRSAELTRQLLGFARRQPVTPRVLDLNASVADMLDMLRQLIGEEIRLTWQPGPELWPVKLDPAQLSQILANLCVNARDAIEGAGTILIATQNVLLDVTTAQSPEEAAIPHVLLTVSDDGSGIDKAILDRLFEPFMTTKGVGKGTGLGLATVYGIVQQNGGDIRVYSEAGIGTTFRIYLPRHTGLEEQVVSQAPSETPRGAGETVLLVEDEVAVMEMAQEALEQLGYVVLVAATPGEALKVAEGYAKPIDLLVTDVIMPEMNGRLLAEQIALQRPALKVLLLLFPGILPT
ncbi:MAG: PAS domain-containing protein [Caldilineaceae bacterium]|nr:PAS domain-containing protein [Caldilineaceae bacterium]